MGMIKSQSAKFMHWTLNHKNFHFKIHQALQRCMVLMLPCTGSHHAQCTWPKANSHMVLIDLEHYCKEQNFLHVVIDCTYILNDNSRSKTVDQQYKSWAYSILLSLRKKKKRSYSGLHVYFMWDCFSLTQCHNTILGNGPYSSSHFPSMVNIAIWISTSKPPKRKQTTSPISGYVNWIS